MSHPSSHSATASPGRRLALYALKAFTWMGGTAVSLGLAVWFMPGIAILPWAYRVPRSGYCTPWKAVTDVSVILRRHDKASSLKQNSTLIQRDGNYLQYKTPLGDWWIPGGNDDILFILLAQQELDIYGAAESNGVRPGDVVLDCGAHVGTFAKRALRNGAARVIAIDPSPDAIFCLRRNLAAEVAAGKVVIVPKGVWDHNGTLTLYKNGNGAAGDSFVVEGDKAEKAAEIPVTTIDSLVADLSLDKVTFIKADVKGASERAIQGGRNTIRKWRPRMAFSTEEAPDDPVSLAKSVAAVDHAYRVDCGPCLFQRDEIRTDVVFFQ